MTLSCVPPVAASLIATTETILHIAPVSKGWKAEAPGNVVFFPPTLTKQALLIQIGLLRPSTIIVADQAIDADIIDQWRISHPFGDLFLVRRGTSLDKVRLDLCARNHIRVVNTPGVNAPHVAAYILHWLTLADGSIPSDICVMGYGNVGKELVKLLLDRHPDIRIRVLARHGQIADSCAKAFPDSRVSFVVDWHQAMQGAQAVAVCLSLNAESAHRIDQSLIQCMQKKARLVCVAKPDVFSDDALQALAWAEDIQLVLDYGPVTLDGFRMRTQVLGCSTCTWCKPAMLTTQAATSEACNCDLDYAVSVQLSLLGLRGLVRRKLAQSLTLPAQRVEAGAPRVSIIGRGINGLLQAVMCRLANYQVTVYGGDQESEGASHKNVNMRHLSATETTAKPLHNGYLLSGNQCLAVECNRAGIELFEKLLADNPSLAPFAQSHYGGPRIAPAADVSSYDLNFLQIKDEIVVLLQLSGVQFLPQYPSRSQIADLSRTHFVVTAMGVEQTEVVARPGTLDGISIVHWSAYNCITAEATYDFGTTQGLVWASLVQELIQARACALLGEYYKAAPDSSSSGDTCYTY